jgi:hypothetical protein
LTYRPEAAAKTQAAKMPDRYEIITDFGDFPETDVSL